MSLPPTFGHAPPITCSRIGCTFPATWHVMWEDSGRNGLCCDEHMSEARHRWTFVGFHPYRMDCSMPGAVWVWDENVCVVDEEGLGLTALAMSGSLG